MDLLFLNWVSCIHYLVLTSLNTLNNTYFKFVLFFVNSCFPHFLLSPSIFMHGFSLFFPSFLFKFFLVGMIIHESKETYWLLLTTLVLELVSLEDTKLLPKILDIIDLLYSFHCLISFVVVVAFNFFIFNKKIYK